MAKETSSEPTGVRAKTECTQTGNEGRYDFPLKECGVTPACELHQSWLWMRAQRIGKGDMPKRRPRLFARRCCSMAKS